MKRNTLESKAAGHWDELLANGADSSEYQEALALGPKLSELFPYLPSTLNRKLYTARPLILTDSFQSQVGETTLGVLKAVQHLVEYLPEKTLLSFAHECGVSPEYSVLVREALKAPTSEINMARPDVILHEGQPKILELNIDSVLGGIVDVGVLTQPYLASAFGQIITAAHNLRGYNPMAQLAAFIQSEWRTMGLSGVPSVAFADFVYDKHFYAYSHQQAALLSSYGVPAKFVTPEQHIELRDEYLYCEGARIDAMIRNFPIEQMEFPRDETFLRPFLKATAAGKLLWLPNERQTLASDKRILGLLWQELARLSSADQELVRKAVPWSALISPQATVEFEGHPIEIAKLLSPEHRERFVIKRGVGHAGESVTIGNHTSAAEWSKQVSKALSTPGFMVQEYIQPDTVTLPLVRPEQNTVSFERCELLLGALVVGGANAGFLVRIRPFGLTGPINQAQGATCTTSLIESPE